MKMLALFIVSCFFYTTTTAQDFIYEGPAKSEVRSFWTNAMGIQRSGKIAEGIAMMEAKLAIVKQKDPAYKTADMEAELKKWKDKQSATVPEKPTVGGSGKPSLPMPAKMVNAADLVVSTSVGDYSGPAKMYLTNYVKQAVDAKKFLQMQSFETAGYKLEQMEKSLNMIKTKDPAFAVAAIESELANFKAALETEKYNQAKGNAVAGDDREKNRTADELLRQLFESTHIGFSTGDEPVMELRVNEYKAKTQSYIAVGAKGTENQLSYMKKLVTLHMVQTNQEIVLVENLMNKAVGTNWAKISYYTIQYHLAYWEAAKLVYPDEADFTAMYTKLSNFANQIGSIENIKSKGTSNNDAAVKNRKLPPAVMKDAAAEKMMIDAFNLVYGADYKGKAYKAIILQSEWHPVRNEITGVITGRQRQFAIVYKGNDGKCYLVNSVYLYQNNTGGNSYGNTIAKYATASGIEILCENVK